MSDKEIIKKIHEKYSFACYDVSGMRGLKYAMKLARKEVFDDIETMLFDKHLHKNIYIRYKISGAELAKLKKKLLGTQKATEAKG